MYTVWPKALYRKMLMTLDLNPCSHVVWEKGPWKWSCKEVTHRVFPILVLLEARGFVCLFFFHGNTCGNGIHSLFVNRPFSKFSHCNQQCLKMTRNIDHPCYLSNTVLASIWIIGGRWEKKIMWLKGEKSFLFWHCNCWMQDTVLHSDISKNWYNRSGKQFANMYQGS